MIKICYPDPTTGKDILFAECVTDSEADEQVKACEAAHPNVDPDDITTIWPETQEDGPCPYCEQDADYDGEKERRLIADGKL